MDIHKKMGTQVCRAHISISFTPPIKNTTSDQSSGRLKLVLRLDKPKSADTVEKGAPAANDTRSKRTPNAKTPTTPAAEDYTYYSADKKIPKKHHDDDHDEHRPSRKRKAPTDPNFVFDPIYSKKNEDEEEEEEEEVEQKKSKKKSHHHHHRKDASADEWDDSVPTPPLTDHDTHSGFKLKLKLPKPVIPDVPDQAKHKKPEGGSGEGKKKRRNGEEMEEAEATTSRSAGGVKLKIKAGNTPVERRAESEAVVKRPKPEPIVTTKRHSPPRREEYSVERRAPRLESHEKRERPKRISPSLPSLPLPSLSLPVIFLSF